MDDKPTRRYQLCIDKIETLEDDNKPKAIINQLKEIKEGSYS